jgi:hypothetical protein
VRKWEQFSNPLYSLKTASLNTFPNALSCLNPFNGANVLHNAVKLLGALLSELFARAAGEKKILRSVAVAGAQKRTRTSTPYGTRT